MIRKIFASLIVLLVLLLMPVLSLAYALMESYLDTDFYKDEVVIGKLYDTLTDTFKARIEGVKEAGGPEAEGLEYLDVDGLTDILKEVVPPEYLTDVTGQVVDQLAEYPMPNEIVIDTAALKEKLPTAYTEVIALSFSSMPECPAGEEPQYNEDGSPSCMPADVDREALAEEIGEMDVTAAFEDFPEEYKISTESMSPEAKKIIYYLTNENGTIKGLIIAVFLVLLGLVGLVIWKPIRSVAWWMGNTMFWGALPLATLNMVIGETIKYMLPMLADQQPDISIGELEQGIGMLTTILSFITDRMVIHGLVIGTIGVILIITSLVLRKLDKDK